MTEESIYEYIACDSTDEDDQFRNCGRTHTCCCPEFSAQGLCPFTFGVVTEEDI